MRSLILKATALGILASTSFAIPAAQAGGGYHKHHHHAHHRHFHHRHVYVRNYYVYRETTCAKYGWIWYHGHKRWVCIKTW